MAKKPGITESFENDSTFGVYNSQWISKCIAGGIHALAGDSEGAKAAVKSANRSVGVVGGGAVGEGFLIFVQFSSAHP